MVNSIIEDNKIMNQNTAASRTNNKKLKTASPSPECSHCGVSQDPNLPWIEISTGNKDKNDQVYDEVEPHFCPKCEPKVSVELFEQWIYDQVCYYCLRQTLCHVCAEMFLGIVDMVYESNQRLKKKDAEYLQDKSV